MRSYSESFKLQILEELSSGAATKQSLTRRYGLGGQTINRWIKKYKRNDLMSRKVKIQKPGEIDEYRSLKDRIAQLEKAVVELELDKLKEAALLKCALEELGYEDKQAYEKKREAKLSNKQ